MRVSRLWRSAAGPAAASTANRIKSINDIQHLYMMHPTSPGSVFFLPKGTRIVAKLTEFMRAQMRKHGFSEVITPQLFKKELWECSGHWEHYKDDMFGVSGGTEAEVEKFSLKPMNCPGHCVIFKSQERSFRDLPIRFSDFSPLHRNEASGALTGLTRVRRFHQDDGHIFCRPDQVKSEIEKSIQLINSVYKVFGLEHSRVLSTRPEDYIGELSLWNTAESGLREILGANAVINDGDGAFYGPKIDYIVTDNLGKKHQAATIQLDFQLPRNFDLKYDTDGQKTEVPVMIHRAVYGSLERFFALLMDHFGGKWPFWLNPLQAVVIPVSGAHNEYARKVAAALSNKTECEPVSLDHEEFDVDVWPQAEPLGGRIRKAVEAAASYVIVVGDREVAEDTISVRSRDEGRKLVSTTVTQLLDEFKKKQRSYIL